MSSRYVPDRNDIVWLDFEPSKGKEIGKYRPTLVLSGKAYNQATGLLIGCPISTSIRGAVTEGSGGQSQDSFRRGGQPDHDPGLDTTKSAKRD